MIEVLILTIVALNCFLLIVNINGIYKQNEELRQEIKELKIMLKDRTIHVTHKVRE